MFFGAPLHSMPRPCLQWVEIATSFQLPSFSIVGLPSPEVAEAKERVRAAIESSGFKFPRKRVVLNLSPASIKKQGTGMDLAMALSIVQLTEFQGITPRLMHMKVVAWGELGLDGSIKGVGQVTRLLVGTWEAEIPLLLIAESDFQEARETLLWMSEFKFHSNRPPQIISVAHLKIAVKKMKTFDLSPKRYTPTQKSKALLSRSHTKQNYQEPSHLLSMTPALQRIIGVSAAGAHHLLLLGPRGVGKSHALEWMCYLQPPVATNIQIDNKLLSELIPSQARLLNKKNFIMSQNSRQILFDPAPPIRKIGTSVKPTALIGSYISSTVRPGEFALAHGGLLIADEFLEWASDARESLREPLETGKIQLCRVGGSIEFPARFTFAGSGNLCRCGGLPLEIYLPAKSQDVQNAEQNFTKCVCSITQRINYLKRASGPIIDRLDLVILLTPKNFRNLSPDEDLPHGALRLKVQRTREKLNQLYGNPSGHLDGVEIENFLSHNAKVVHHLSKFKMDGLRSRHKLVRLAMTLAAWDSKENLDEGLLAEAFFYRSDRFRVFA